MRPRLLVLALLLATAGCAASGAPRANTTPSHQREVVAVEVRNLSRVSADVYYGYTLLGMVSPGARERFPLPQGAPRQTVRFILAGESPQTGPHVYGLRAHFVFAGSGEGP